jgi:hypothetical protein
MKREWSGAPTPAAIWINRVGRPLEACQYEAISMNWVHLGSIWFLPALFAPLGVAELQRLHLRCCLPTSERTPIPNYRYFPDGYFIFRGASAQ